MPAIIQNMDLAALALALPVRIADRCNVIEIPNRVG
jgi:hypothetical protein